MAPKTIAPSNHTDPRQLGRPLPLPLPLELSSSRPTTMGGTWATRVTATKAEKGLLQRSPTAEQHPPQTLFTHLQVPVHRVLTHLQVPVHRLPIPLHNMAAIVCFRVSYRLLLYFFMDDGCDVMDDEKRGSNMLSCQESTVLNATVEYYVRGKSWWTFQQMCGLSLHDSNQIRPRDTVQVRNIRKGARLAPFTANGHQSVHAHTTCYHVLN